jgi:hypothetical protein
VKRLGIFLVKPTCQSKGPDQLRFPAPLLLLDG